MGGSTGRSRVDAGMRLVSLWILIVLAGTAHSEPSLVDRGPATAAAVPVDLEQHDAVFEIDRGRAQRRWAIGFAVGGGLLWIAANQLSWYERAEWERVRRDDARAANHAVDVARYGGTGLFAAGTISLGVALYLAFTAPRKETVHKGVWMPSVQPDRVGVALGGTF